MSFVHIYEGFNSTYCGLIAIKCLSLVFLVYNRFFYLVPVLNKEKELKLINAIKFSAIVQQLKRCTLTANIEASALSNQLPLYHC